jgi:hypothetical protein
MVDPLVEVTEDGRRKGPGYSAPILMLLMVFDYPVTFVPGYTPPMSSLGSLLLTKVI